MRFTWSLLALLGMPSLMMAQSYFIKGPEVPKPSEKTAIQEMTDYLARRIGDKTLSIGGKTPVTFQIGDTELARQQKCLSTELEDERWVIRSIGDPEIRFREDPVRMMRAIKFSSRLGFRIERKTAAAMKKLHACILSAAVPRVCEEVFRLFPYGCSEEAFRQMYACGLLGDLLPDLAKFIDSDGGSRSATWKYLATLDRYERAMHERGVEVANGLRAAVLYAAMAKSRPGRSREVMGTMLASLKIPKAIYFLATLLIDSVKRLSQPPQRARRRFIHNRDFVDALDFNRILARAEGRSEDTLDAWDALSRKTCNEQGDKNDRKERS